MGDFREYGKKIIQAERDTLETLMNSIDDSFDKAVELIRTKEGRVCVTGMGKAGIIANKIAGTFASTGTRAFYMHPADASHGDLGMIDSTDIVLALSNSGESSEIVSIIPSLKTISSGLIAITGAPSSTLAAEADIVLSIGSIDEACPLGLAPTSSTTAMLAMGDALALTLMEFNDNFDKNRYAFFHPGGSLGKRLLRVGEVMKSGEDCPILSDDSQVKDVLFAITKSRAGGAIITDGSGKLSGFFADGDLRRGIEKYGDIMKKNIREFMTENPKTISKDAFALEALSILNKFRIGEIPVVGPGEKPVGMIALKDLIAIGLLS